MGQFYSDFNLGFWACVTVSAGTPTLASSFNVASITDTGLGQLTITFSVPFVSATWACVAMAELTSTSLVVANARKVNVANGGRAAGSVLLDCSDNTAVTNLLADPASWNVGGMGTQ